MRTITSERYRGLPKVTETQHQQALIAWWAVFCKTVHLPEIALMHIPNEGKRSFRAGLILQSMGLRKGVSDLFLSVPNGGKHGLWLEMKTEKGKASKEQLDFRDSMRELGYEAEICHGWEQGRQVIERYLSAPQVLPVLRD